jgi:hypothetical protein
MFSASMAWKSMLPDVHQSPDRANEHGMAEPGQNPQKAAQEIQNYIKQQLARGTERSTANALHDVQDLSARDHGADKVWNGRLKDYFTREFLKHFLHDLDPSDVVVREAIRNSRNLLKKAPYLNKRK